MPTITRRRKSLRDNARCRVIQQLLIPLTTPRNNDGSVFINPYGNILNDIENEDAQKALAETFEPSYMGAAEFEWGALPKSLSRMFEDNTIVHHELPLVENGSGLESRMVPPQIYYVGSSEVIAENIGMIYKIYEKGYMNRSEKYPKEVSKNDYGSLYVQLKAKYDGIDQYIENAFPKYNERLMGWYDLEHDFAVFTDLFHSQMFYKLVKGNQDAK